MLDHHGRRVQCTLKAGILLQLLELLIPDGETLKYSLANNLEGTYLCIKSEQGSDFMFLITYRDDDFNSVMFVLCRILNIYCKFSDIFPILTLLSVITVELDLQGSFKDFFVDMMKDTSCYQFSNNEDTVRGDVNELCTKAEQGSDFKFQLTYRDDYCISNVFVLCQFLNIYYMFPL